MHLKPCKWCPLADGCEKRRKVIDALRPLTRSVIITCTDMWKGFKPGRIMMVSPGMTTDVSVEENHDTGGSEHVVWKMTKWRKWGHAEEEDENCGRRGISIKRFRSRYRGEPMCAAWILGANKHAKNPVFVHRSEVELLDEEPVPMCNECGCPWGTSGKGFYDCTVCGEGGT